MEAQKLIRKLLRALKNAEQHLEYTGYGDSWERECAKDSKLPSKITSAISAGENYFKK